MVRASVYWIQRANIKRGALREYIRRRYGSRGFTGRGTIKTSILHELIRDPKVTMTTKRRAQLALNLKGLKTHKRLPKRQHRRVSKPVVPDTCSYVGWSPVTKRHYIRLKSGSGSYYSGQGRTEADYRFESTPAGWPLTKKLYKIRERR